MGAGYRFAAVFGAICAFAALLVATAALAGSGGGNKSEQAPVAARTIDVEVGDLFIKPNQISAPKGTDVTIHVHNGGGIEHNLTVQGGPATANIKPGQDADLHLGRADADSYTLFCSIPGHRDAGMVATLKTTSDGAAAAPAAPQAAGTMTPAQMDESYLAGIKAFPAKTKGQGNQRLEPTIDNGVKVFELTAAETDWEVAPGDVRHGMAFNGIIPGPEIHVALGDRVRIVLHNQLKESTGLHFHGLLVPNAQDGVPGLTQPVVKPGDSYTYEFTIRDSGSNMYHAHMDSQMQVPSGLLGAFIVDEANPPTVQVDHTMILNDGPLGFTINGKSFPATEPVVARPGDRVRIRYMNEGLQIHPMHLHGLPQTVIALDGHPLSQPYTEDTVMVAPGQRVDVLVDATEPGLWAFHCHILTHAESEAGYIGMTTVFIVQ